jgi:hypothetical protein
MSTNTNQYKIIDNIPQKRDVVKPIDVLVINQMIEGFETVQNTLDNIDNTNKYEVELTNEQVPIIIKPVQDSKLMNYIALIENPDEKKEKFETIEYVPKNSSPVHMDMITSFYVGSLSIVGLFILYRFIQRSK